MLALAEAEVVEKLIRIFTAEQWIRDTAAEAGNSCYQDSRIAIEGLVVCERRQTDFGGSDRACNVLEKVEAVFLVAELKLVDC